MRLFRIAWVIPAIVVLGLNAAGIPYAYEYYASVCILDTETCFDEGLLAPEGARLHPENFGETVNAVLARPEERPEELERSVGRLEDLLGVAEELCAYPRLEPDRSTLRIPSVPLLVFAALAVHPTRRFEDVLRVEAPEGAGLQDLIHRVLGDHHPLSRVRHGQRLVERAIDQPDDPSSRTRTG